MANETSPGLEVVSENFTKGDLAKGDLERRRVPRLNLSTEQFRLSGNNKIYPVADLSSDGMALRVLEREDLAHFPIGTVLAGNLNLRRQKYSLQARVRHIGKDLVGCQFEPLTEEARQAIATFLDPVEIGRSLKPIPAAERGMLWYSGPSGTHLLLWRGADGQYLRFALFVLGSFIQWEDGIGVTTGRMMSSFEPSEVRGAIRFETMLLEKDAAADSGKLCIAKTVLLSSNLPQDLRTWCLRHLDAAPGA